MILFPVEKTLNNKMVKAIPEAVVNARAFVAFTEALREDHSSELSQWLQQVVKWEQSGDGPCPYDIPNESACFCSRRLLI